MPIIPPGTQRKLTEAQARYIESLMIDLGLWDDRYEYFETYLGTRDLFSITIFKASEFIDQLKKWRDA